MDWHSQALEREVTHAAIEAASKNPCGWVYAVQAICPPEALPPASRSSALCGWMPQGS
jgi:hypothetical protein